MLSARFLDGSKGPILVVTRGHLRAAARCVLVLPPFAEELNKSRAMIAQVAQSLAERGVATVMPDLFGTGDSGGEFSAASADVWRDDVRRVVAWCAREGRAIDALLAIRLGAAWAVAWVGDVLPMVERTVFWQPVFDGRRALTQFLRLRLAATLLTAKSAETAADLRRKLEQEGVLEVAGYELSRKMAADLETLSVPAALPVGFGATRWFELVQSAETGIAPPTERLLTQTRANGGRVEYAQWLGEPYWSATEIVRHRDLMAATVTFLAAESTV